MFRALLVFLALNTASVFLVHQLLDGFIVEGGTLGYVLIGVMIGFLNLFVKPVLKVLSLPFIFLTAGLFVIFINALIIWLTQSLVNFVDIAGISLTIEGMGSYIAAVLLFGILNYIFQKLLR